MAHLNRLDPFKRPLRIRTAGNEILVIVVELASGQSGSFTKLGFTDANQDVLAPLMHLAMLPESPLIPFDSKPSPDMLKQWFAWNLWTPGSLGSPIQAPSSAGYWVFNLPAIDKVVTPSVHHGHYSFELDVTGGSGNTTSTPARTRYLIHPPLEVANPPTTTAAIFYGDGYTSGDLGSPDPEIVTDQEIIGYLDPTYRIGHGLRDISPFFEPFPAYQFGDLSRAEAFAALYSTTEFAGDEEVVIETITTPPVDAAQFFVWSASVWLLRNTVVDLSRGNVLNEGSFVFDHNGHGGLFLKYDGSGLATSQDHVDFGLVGFGTVGDATTGSVPGRKVTIEITSGRTLSVTKV